MVYNTLIHNKPMNFTKRQLILLQTALTVFYDEIAKTATPTMKTEVMEIAQMVQDAYEEAAE